MTPRLLLINPNTSASVTALLLGHVQQQLGAGIHVEARTARFGAPYIADEQSYAIAAGATLDAWTPQADFDAVLVGCFGDPGLLALRAVAGVPVTGLAEAAFAEAALQGRFAIVTGGARWRPMLQSLAAELGYAESLAGVQTVQPTGAEMAADPAGALCVLADACRAAIAQWQPQSLIIGGAGLAGMAERLQAQFALPLIDSVAAGARQAGRLAMAAKGAAPRP